MRASIFVCFCISFLSSVIQCSPDLYINSVVAVMNERAIAGQRINDIWLPSVNGFIVRTCGYAFTYKGTLIKPDESRKEVAMKFTLKQRKNEAANEYLMYAYLNAINNENVEQYGIPSVHYFGRWANFVMMAITVLDTNMESKKGNLQEIDGLIMFRDFVKASKYIHGCGICHADIRPENIMFRRNNAFIIDFNFAQKLGELSANGTLKYNSLHAHLKLRRSPNDDWENFLYSMFDMFGVQLDWFNVTEIPEHSRERFATVAKFFKRNVTPKIEYIPTQRLKTVFDVFTNQVFAAGLIPVYDGVYNLIDGFIASSTSQAPALVSFIKTEDRRRAISESRTIFNISSVVGPSENRRISYPEMVDYDVLGRMYGREENLWAFFHGQQ